MAVATLPKRPLRRMPSMKSIEAYHELPPATCFRCGVIAQTVKAHVVDRYYGNGLDGVQNLRPLCHACHRDQPSFCGHELDEAMLWFSTDEWDYVAGVFDMHRDEATELLATDPTVEDIDRMVWSWYCRECPDGRTEDYIPRARTSPFTDVIGFMADHDIAVETVPRRAAS